VPHDLYQRLRRNLLAAALWGGVIPLLYGTAALDFDRQIQNQSLGSDVGAWVHEISSQDGLDQRGLSMNTPFKYKIGTPFGEMTFDNSFLDAKAFIDSNAHLIAANENERPINRQGNPLDWMLTEEERDWIKHNEEGWMKS
jgi:hypothetical protein